MIDNKFYIGKHSTNVLEDGYLGSGIHLNRAIKKHGRENFVRVILFIFDNNHEMNQMEKMLITEEMITDNNCYNMAIGGQGGNLGSLVNSKIGKNTSMSLKGKSKSESHKQALRETNFARTYKPTEKTKDKISETLKITWDNMTVEERHQKCDFSGEKNPFYNKTHKSESIDKMRETIGDSRKGSKNANSKPVTVNGVTYQTRKECLEILGITKRKLYKILGEI